MNSTTSRQVNLFATKASGQHRKYFRVHKIVMRQRQLFEERRKREKKMLTSGRKSLFDRPY